MTIASAAADLDEALAAAERAVVAFHRTMLEANRAHHASQPATFSGYPRSDHAVYADPLRFVTSALSGCPMLAKAVGLPARPAFSIADAVS